MLATLFDSMRLHLRPTCFVSKIILKLNLRQVTFVIFICHISLFFFLAPTIHLLQSVSIVIVGDDLTLPCENVTHGQDDCNSTTWAFSGSTDTAVVELATHGQIHKDVRAKSARLSVSEDCSLVVNKVTVEDAGRYTCRQIKSGNEVSEFDVYLSVINSEYFIHNFFSSNCA